MSISEIIGRLFGKINPVGDQTQDDIRYENIQNYYEALCYIVAALRNASNYKDRPEYSMQKIGKECYDILREFEIED